MPKTLKFESLKGNSEFKKILSAKKVSSDLFTIYYANKETAPEINKIHISFVSAKKLGNAVKRNKIRRRLKMAARKAITEIDSFRLVKIMIKKIDKLFSLILTGFIKFYKFLISPFFHNACHYDPTCSEYFIQSLKEFGFIKGSLKGILRILRCHPIKFLGGGFGYDPVINRKIKDGK